VSDSHSESSRGADAPHADVLTAGERGAAKPRYREQEQAAMRTALGSAVHATVEEIESLCDTWVRTDVPFPPTLGRLTANEPIRPWPVSRSVAWRLYSILRLVGSRHALEIGTSMGYSALWMAAALANTGGTLTTCEAHAEKCVCAAANFRRAGVSNIYLLEGNARETLVNWMAPIDFLFLDADGENYEHYWSLLEPCLVAGCVLVMDNAISHESVNRAFVARLKAAPGWDSWLEPVHNGVLIARNAGRVS
jgi:predicted O-methyltransferase YrrM